MQRSFDDKLADKIRDSFEHYEEPFNQAHLNLLKKKQNENKRIAIMFQNFTKAAAVLVLFSLPLYYFYRNNLNSNYFGVKTNDVAICLQIEKLPNYKHEITANVKESTNNLKKNYITTTNREEDSNSDAILAKLNDCVKTSNDSLQSRYFAETNVNNHTLAFLDSLKQKGNSLIRNDIVSENRTSKVVDTSFNQNTQKELFNDFVIIENKKRSRIKFGVSLQSNVGYSSSINSAKMNLGGGISTEIPVFAGISVNSGVLFAQQSYTINASRSEVPLKIIGRTTISEGKNAEITTLDIPLNLLYSFNVGRKSKLVIQSGISSIYYINENYSEGYRIYDPLPAAATMGQPVDIERSSTSFESQQYSAVNRFDFAKLLNFSVGYSFPVRKNMLVFEPYLKVPIGEMTTEKIKLGFGGISVRYSFGKK